MSQCDINGCDRRGYVLYRRDDVTFCRFHDYLFRQAAKEGESELTSVSLLGKLSIEKQRQVLKDREASHVR